MPSSVLRQQQLQLDEFCLRLEKTTFVVFGRVWMPRRRASPRRLAKVPRCEAKVGNCIAWLNDGGAGLAVNYLPKSNKVLKSFNTSVTHSCTKQCIG